MIAKHAVIQKIDTSCRVEVFYTVSDHLSWTFEHRRNPIQADNKDIFPIIFRDSPSMNRREPGAETVCLKKGEVISFHDDYSIPGGFLVSILPPLNHLPILVKFTEMASIPIHGSAIRYENPGYVRIYSNNVTRQSAIVMVTTSDTFFGFSAMFKPCSGVFPSNNTLGSGSDFKASVMMIPTDPRFLTQDDLLRYSCTIDESIMNELLASLNTLVSVMKKEENIVSLDSLKHSICRCLAKAPALVAGVTAMADSYSSQGFAYDLLYTLVNYFDIIA